MEAAKQLGYSVLAAVMLHRVSSIDTLANVDISALFKTSVGAITFGGAVNWILARSRANAVRLLGLSTSQQNQVAHDEASQSILCLLANVLKVTTLHTFGELLKVFYKEQVDVGEVLSKAIETAKPLTDRLRGQFNELVKQLSESSRADNERITELATSLTQSIITNKTQIVFPTASTTAFETWTQNLAAKVQMSPLQFEKQMTQLTTMSKKVNNQLQNIQLVQRHQLAAAATNPSNPTPTLPLSPDIVEALLVLQTLQTKSLTNDEKIYAADVYTELKQVRTMYGLQLALRALHILL